MITYVNTVLVSNNESAKVHNKFDIDTLKDAKAGDFFIQNLDDNADNEGKIDENTDKIRIGVVLASTTNFTRRSGEVVVLPEVKWSNEIKKRDIKSYRKLEIANFKAITGATSDSTEDTIEIDFTKSSDAFKNAIAVGGKIVVVRLTFKDMPTRFRNWTESYDYMTTVGEDAESLAEQIAAVINKATKRARVIATANGGKVTLVAMKYDDDNSVDTINWSAKVRFNANLYWQDPNAAGFASSNKYSVSIDPKFITKTEGKTYEAAAKLVRDHESIAMGYQGILNRGECTWPIIKPAMVTDITKEYDALTLEFENMYRAADDIFRKTKQTVEIYVPAGKLSTISDELKSFVGKPETSLNDTKDGEPYQEIEAA